MESKFVKTCLICEREQVYHSKDALTVAILKNSRCLSCAASQRPKLMGKLNPNHKHDKLERICHNCKLIIRYKSLNSFCSARRRNSMCRPCGLAKHRAGYYRYNPKACQFFSLVNERMNWEGRHALNGGEYQVLQYFIDYYEPNLNLVIEYDEPHHKYRRERDRKRQEKIQKKLNCKFIRISSTLDIDSAIEYIRGAV